MIRSIAALLVLAAGTILAQPGGPTVFYPIPNTGALPATCSGSIGWVVAGTGVIYTCVSGAPVASGGSSGQYSAPSVGYTTGTYYFPAGGGLAANGTQANVQTAQGGGGTVSNFAFNFPAGSGSGTAVVTWYDGSTPEAVTCSVSASSNGCSDTTHTFNYLAGDLLSVKMVVSTATITSAVTMTWGTGQIGPTGMTSGPCTIDNDTQSATALIAADFSGGCEFPIASTVVEVDVWGGTGVIGGSVTTTGTSSVNIQKYSPNGGGTTTLLSGALATVSGYACAKASTSATCVNGLTSSGSVSISTTALSAGDWVRVSAATPDTTQTWYRIAIYYTTP